GIHRVGLGTVAIAHVRLAIIDLTSGGHQPMSSPDGTYWITYNGEIYNYRELRRELQAAGFRFRTDSDTEVLLTAWQRWGRGCLDRLDGMFAFAVLAKGRKTLTCVRDHFGVKPLIYSPRPDSLLFASDIAAIQALHGTKGSLNWQQAYDYLVHGTYDFSPST